MEERKKSVALDDAKLEQVTGGDTETRYIWEGDKPAEDRDNPETRIGSSGIESGI